MKGLNQFQVFDWDKFSEGKKYITTGVSEWLDYNTKAHLGTKIEVIIIEDKTKYAFNEGNEFTNRFEKLTFKLNKDVKIPLNTQVVPRDVTATIYGNYRNELSVKCCDISIVEKKEG